MNIFISMPQDEISKTFLTSSALEKLREIGTVTQNPTNHQLNAEELIQYAKNADVILCGWGCVKFTKEITTALPSLKIIAYVGGSLAPVLEADALQNGIVALTGNYIFAKSVAEGCLTYILCSLREIEKYMNLVRNGSWREDEFYNRGLFGKRIGIVGFGEIAKNLVTLLKPFDMEILIDSRHLTEEQANAYGAKLASREEIFSTCDIVSLHLSLTEKTKKSIDRALLEKLKPDALFVNTARGAVVDEEALEELLANKRFYAALDTFSQEPLPKNCKLRTLDNVVILPHMGGPTIDVREYITVSFAKDFEAFQKGLPMKNQFDISSLSYMSKPIQ